MRRFTSVVKNCSSSCRLGVIDHPLKTHHNRRFITENPGVMARGQQRHIAGLKQTSQLFVLARSWTGVAHLRPGSKTARPIVAPSILISSKRASGTQPPRRTSLSVTTNSVVIHVLLFVPLLANPLQKQSLKSMTAWIALWPSSYSMQVTPKKA